jgi:hypothetical protein
MATADGVKFRSLTLTGQMHKPVAWIGRGILRTDPGDVSCFGVGVLITPRRLPSRKCCAAAMGRTSTMQPWRGLVRWRSE